MGILEDLMPGAYGLPNAQPQTPDIRELVWAAARKFPPSVVGADLARGAPAEAPATVTVPPRPAFGMTYTPDAPPASPPPAAAPTASIPAAPRPVAPELAPLQQKFANPQRSIGETIADTVAGFASGPTPMASIAGAITGYRSGEDQRLAQSANYKFLVEKTGDPVFAMAAMTNPEIMRTALPSLLAGKTQVINNRLVDSKTGRVIADYSDTARQGPEIKDVTLADGTKVSMQFDHKSGEYKPVGGPMAPAPGAMPVPPGVDPKKYRETAAAKLAEDTIKAKTALPEALRSADFVIGKIDDVLKDDALWNVTGPIMGNTKNFTPWAVRAQSKIDQLQGQAFLEAYQALRGTGAISNTEGAKAEAALARLKAQGVTTEDYKKALNEFRQEVVNLREIAIKKAEGNFSPLPEKAAGSDWETVSPGIRIREKR